MTAEPGRRQGTDPATLERHFGRSGGLIPMWIAEPSVDTAPQIVEALRARATEGWYGYEVRPESLLDGFWRWMNRRHGWSGDAVDVAVSPSVGASIGAVIADATEPGDGVIIQPPVFTDFKPSITAADRRPVRNPLHLGPDGYHLDLDHLAATAAEPENRMLILCSPHNPVGRVWTRDELDAVATICAEHGVLVLADEIHADVVIHPNAFVPFAEVAADVDLDWAATHGPIKTFGLAGVCDTLLVSDRPHVLDRFRARSSQFHLTRNNVLGLAAFEAAYRDGDEWFDDFLALIARNYEVLAETLPDPIRLVEPEGTYLAWLDLRELGLEVPEIPGWLTSAGIAMSPGHWFGREGAGFARMTIASPTAVVERAVEGLRGAVAGDTR